MRSKKSQSSILGFSIASMKSSKKACEESRKILEESSTAIAKIATMEKEEKGKIDKKTEEMERKIKAIEAEYEGLMESAKKNIKSLTADDMSKLETLPNKAKDYNKDIKDLKESRDYLASKVYTAILNSTSHYLKLHTKKSQEAALSKIVEEARQA